MPTFTVTCGDSLEILKQLPDRCVHACVTDAPYGLSEHRPEDVVACLTAWLAGQEYRPKKKGFMGRAWDAWVPGPELWREVYRVLKPGGHVLAMAGSRTQDLMGMAIRLAGFEMRDSIDWLYGCFDAETEVLTPNGWVNYAACHVGDSVLGYDPVRETVRWLNVQDRPMYDYDDVAFNLVGDGVDQLLSRGHRCIVERNGNLCGATIEEVAQEYQVRVPVLEGVPGLLRRLSVPGSVSSRKEEDVFVRVRCACHRQVEAGASREANSHQEGAVCRVCRMRNGGVEIRIKTEKSNGTLLLLPLQWNPPRGVMARAWQQRKGRMEPGGNCIGESKVDGGRKPRMERRCNDISRPRKLRGCQVRSMSTFVYRNGPEGWLCYGASTYRSRPPGPMSSPFRGCASQQPRPDRQQTGEPDVVPNESGSQGIRVARQTRTVVVRVEPVPFKGTMWCVTVETGAIIARRRGCVFITGNSGFPKSLDVGKAIDAIGGIHPNWQPELYEQAVRASGFTHADIDRHLGLKASSCYWARTDHRRCVPAYAHWALARDMLGLDDSFAAVTAEAERAALGQRSVPIGHAFAGPAYGGDSAAVTFTVTAPATEAAKRWDGWGTALKPAHEPIIVARKPLEGTVAANVVKYGTGGLNIDGCRVGGGDARKIDNYQSTGPQGCIARPGDIGHAGRTYETRLTTAGRWPPNVLLSHARGCVQVGTVTIPGDARAGQEDKLGGTRPGGFGDVGAASGADKPNGSVYGPTEAPLWACVPGCPIRALDDQAGQRKPASAVSRFFPILPIDDPTEAPFFYSSKTSPTERNDGLDEGDLNRHPTVKPTALMAWACRLVTPPGGIVLDPFTGSGSTGRGAVLEGFGFIGMEIDPESVRVARLRIAAVARAPC